MTMYDIIARIRNMTGLEVTLENSELKFSSPDCDLLPFCSFSAAGLVVGIYYSDHAADALISWEEIEFIKKSFNYNATKENL